MDFIHLSPNHYKVKSRSSEKWYFLNRYAEDVASCSCPGFKHRQYCVHSEALALDYPYEPMPVLMERPGVRLYG